MDVRALRELGVLMVLRMVVLAFSLWCVGILALFSFLLLPLSSVDPCSLLLLLRMLLIMRPMGVCCCYYLLLYQLNLCVALLKLNSQLLVLQLLIIMRPLRKPKH